MTKRPNPAKRRKEMENIKKAQDALEAKNPFAWARRVFEAIFKPKNKKKWKKKKK